MAKKHTTGKKKPSRRKNPAPEEIPQVLELEHKEIEERIRPTIPAGKEKPIENFLLSDEDLEAEWNRRLKELEERNRQFALKTTQAHTPDRMIRYSRNPGCPECGAHPVVCMMRRPGYRKFRCRVCGYVFEDEG